MLLGMIEHLPQVPLGTCCHTCRDAVGFLLYLLLHPTVVLLMHSQETKTRFEVSSSYRLKASGDADLSA